jgi:hypothetical protein
MPLQTISDIITPCLCFHNLCIVQWGDTEIVALCNSKDSAHIVANFDTLPSARKFLFIHEILGTKSLLCPQHVYQISKLEY